ncbi:MAG: hypothetical protein R3248_11670 [Candidatus Promineifilaceae bacterium]|nr:hypothetical protein [Candidatus Promineifilaceae bacterium]
MPDDKVRAAIALAKAGRRRQARELFLQIVEEDPRNEVAWLWLVGLVDDVEDQIIALENVLVINPDNHRARARLERVRRMKEAAATAPPADREESDEDAPPPAVPTPPAAGDEEETSANTLMATGRWHEYHGRLEEAATFYKRAQALGTTQRGRQRAGKRLKEVERRLELRQPIPTNTTFTLVRLTIGPFLLYLLLIFIQAAFRPWRVSPLLCLGGLPVLAGSALLVGTRVTPRHPWWRQLFGIQRLDTHLRVGLALLGFFLLLMPYFFFLWSAYNRLNP